MSEAPPSASSRPTGPDEACGALAAACARGDRRAASKLISALESLDPAEARAASRAAARLPRASQVIALTGPPGAGKSTLLDYLIALYRQSGRTAGVIAVDPSSPFTGGALLGDRIRMASHRADAGVFIRSMGSRGATGGLAAAASDALRVLGGAGFGVVFLETVGAGQSEIEVIGLADSICVIQVPGLGDDVQLMKMGILEIADVFVVNKADRPGAKELAGQIEQAIGEAPGEVCRALRQLGPEFRKAHSGAAWTPPVLLLSGLARTGGEELVAVLDRHAAYLAAPALSKALTRQRAAREILRRSARAYQDRLVVDLATGGRFAALVDACAAGSVDLDDALRQVLE